MNSSLSKIQNAVRSLRGIPPKKRAQLRRLLSELEREIRRLPKNRKEHAESIAGFAQVAAHEAGRARPSRRLMKVSREGLALSVKGFEASHPVLTRVINEICRELSSVGI